MYSNNYKHTCLLALSAFLIFACGAVRSQTMKGSRPIVTLQNNFINIPDTIQTSIYWYWLSDNISKEGVVKDLESMKKVGINRAFIGNIGLNDVPYGKVKLFSEEWWDIMHTALKTATRLNIEIGIFNSPGWSQSGGPWVKPDQSMRYLTSSELFVKGPAKFSKKLLVPEKDFQDVRVIAYPVQPDFNSDISQLRPKLSSASGIENLQDLMDHNEKTEITFKQPLTINISSKTPYTARSLTVYPAHREMRLIGEIQVNTDGIYRTLKHFDIDRSNSQLNVGFKPFGPAAFSIPATTAKEFRILFTEASNSSGITEIKLSSTPVVENYIEKTLAKMWQTPYPYWDAYQWPAQLAVDDLRYTLDPGKVLDISKFMTADGTLNWNIPSGSWIIERFGMTPTQVTNSPAAPEGTGLETDKMSKKHIEAHFNAFLGEIIRRIPAEDRKTWKVAVEDSYETGGQNWTDQLIEKFKQHYHYDPIPYMPVLNGKVVGTENLSDRFLWDLRRFIADNVAYEYVAGLREISHKFGLTTWLENYGHWGFPGEFLQYGGQSDEIGGEFWSEGSLGNIENRAASSSAHIYGKTKVSAESFTAGGAAFVRYPAMMKQRADRFFTEGINNTLLHVFVHQPTDKAPGTNAPFGSEFNRLNTWFYDMDIFLKYIKRCNMMLQQGKYIADVAYFIGEDAPKMTGIQDPPLPLGYSFDYINAEVIKTRLNVTDGQLVLPDSMAYRLLVLPKLESIRPEVLLKIKELVELGAVILGPKPSRSPSLQGYGKADEQVKAIADELWGKIDGRSTQVNKVGKGYVINGMDVKEALSFVKIIPDFKVTGSDSVLFIHRKVDSSDIYFVSNQKSSPVKINAEFRVFGKTPELWDPVSGNVRKLPFYHQSQTTTEIPLEFAALESTFIVFKDDQNITKPDTLKHNYPLPSKIMDLKDPWTVIFNPEMKGPVKPVIFETLTDWAQNTSDSIKYYSGSAVYRYTLKTPGVKKGENAILNLGIAKAIAKVTLNGVEMGGAWTAPYKIDVTKALKKGNNILEIKVVNTWVNRLIGDSKLPMPDRKTWTIHNPYGPESKLESSGLLGPVKLEFITY